MNVNFANMLYIQTETTRVPRLASSGNRLSQHVDDWLDLDFDVVNQRSLLSVVITRRRRRRRYASCFLYLTHRFP